jgi:N-acetylmuramoyl-L-alanine amidase
MENPDFENPSENEPQDFDDLQEEKKRHTGYSVMSGFQTVLSIAVVMATLLTLWNPRKFLGTPNLSAIIRAESEQEAPEGEAAEEMDTTDHIGLLAGHWLDSPGEVCADGLVEADVNQDIANRTAQVLRSKGYQVDVFPEYDIALLNYQSAVFVAIYAGSCAESPLPPSGFKVATSLTALNPDAASALAVCLSESYSDRIKIPFSFEVLNPDHPSYHIFRDIHQQTPAALIETGSLKTDRTILVNQAEVVAEAIAAGILCSLEPSSGAGQ